MPEDDLLVSPSAEEIKKPLGESSDNYKTASDTQLGMPVVEDLLGDEPTPVVEVEPAHFNAHEVPVPISVQNIYEDDSPQKITLSEQEREAVLKIEAIMSLSPEMASVSESCIVDLMEESSYKLAAGKYSQGFVTRNKVNVGVAVNSQNMNIKVGYF